MSTSKTEGKAKRATELDAICTDLYDLTDRVEEFADSGDIGTDAAAATARVLSLLRQAESRATEILL